jgi:hypothetical protein
MTNSRQADEYQPSAILDFGDLIAVATLIGILLFIGTSISWGATLSSDPKARTSAVTGTTPQERHERSKAELMDKEFTKFDLGKEPINTRLRGDRSENQTRADEVTTHLVAPWR